MLIYFYILLLIRFDKFCKLINLQKKLKRINLNLKLKITYFIIKEINYIYLITYN